jgi:hypothetical protein
MKARNAIRVCVLLFALPFLLSAQTVSELHYTVEFSQFDLTLSTVNGYDVVRMKGSHIMSELGKPMLPIKTVQIAIPSGTKAIRVEAQSRSSVMLQGNFYVMPGQPPRAIGELNAQLPEKPDALVYNSNIPYPENLATLDHQGNLTGQPIVCVTVYPIQYIPAEQQLLLHNAIELVVYCERDDASMNSEQERYYTFTENQRRLYEEMIKKMVINPYEVTVNPHIGSPSLTVPPGNFNHVIITSSGLASYFEPLVQWYTKKGLKDTVVTTDWIYANYSGPGDTTKIRQFIIDANANWGTMYFLLGGENNTVPYAQRFYHEQSNVPSDQYYSDFDDDWIHEVFVGRASVDGQTQINTFINKVLKYEKDPPPINYPVDVLLIGMDLDASTYGEQLMEDIADYLPAYFNIHKVYDSHAGNHKDSVLAYLSAGQNLVAHADHCNYTVMGVGYVNHGWTMNNTNVDNLTNNNEPCIVTSIGCEPNGFDQNDCISEHFVIYNPNQAGIAFIGNTRHGWGYVGDPGSLSGELVEGWWRGVFQEGLDNIGKAFNYAKHEFNTPSGIQKHCEWTFNILGEPAMTIWTKIPDTLDVSHDPVVPPVPGNFTVTVKDNDGVTAIENALVCCWIPSQSPAMHVADFTNSSGIVTLSISPTVFGDTMFVTVTKQNYSPYESYATIIPLTGPYIVMGTTIIDDGGDGIVNPGETIDFGIWAKNIGVATAQSVYGLLDESDPYATTTTDSSWYGNISHDDSSLSNPDYNFTIASNCPNSHVIEFNLVFHDTNDSIWTAYPEITVFAPVLTYQDVTVVSSNGMLDPGETADIYVTIKNEGDATASNVTSTLITDSPHITINDALGNFGTIDPGAFADNQSDPYSVTASISMPFGSLADFSIIVEAGVYIDTLNFSLVVGQPPPTDTGYYYAYYSGGPYAQVPVFNWFAIDTTQSTYPGISLDLDRNETVVVDLPFTFRYYGVDYSRISICANGWIAMDSTGSIDFSNTGIPNGDGPPAMIAGIWDYLHPGVTDAPGDIYYYYDSENHRFIVEFFKVDHYPSGNSETFEIILNDPVYYATPTGDGEIIVQYPTGIQNPSSVTVGIENAAQTIGIQYFYNGSYDAHAAPITSSFAIKYATYEPLPGVEEAEEFYTAPTTTLLGSAYPNPFSRSIMIHYQLAQNDRVNLRVYDVGGRLVRTLKDEYATPGYYSVMWHGSDDVGRKVPAGIYFIRFRTSDLIKIEKIILLK